MQDFLTVVIILTTASFLLMMTVDFIDRLGCLWSQTLRGQQLELNLVSELELSLFSEVQPQKRLESYGIRELRQKILAWNKENPQRRFSGVRTMKKQELVLALESLNVK